MLLLLVLLLLLLLLLLLDVGSSVYAWAIHRSCSCWLCCLCSAVLVLCCRWWLFGMLWPLAGIFIAFAAGAVCKVLLLLCRTGFVWDLLGETRFITVFYMLFH